VALGRSAFKGLDGKRADRVEIAVAAQQRANLGLSKPTVTAGRANAADPAGRRPTGHGLGIDPEQGGNLAGCEKSITVLHVVCLSLKTGY